VLGCRLGADQGQVSCANRRVDHGISLDPEEKGAAGAGGGAIDGVVFLDVLHRRLGDAGPDGADYRQEKGVSLLLVGGGQPDTAGVAGGAGEITLFFQGSQMAHDPQVAGDLQVPGNLLHGGGITGLVLVGLDEAVDGFLAFGEFEHGTTPMVVTK